MKFVINGGKTLSGEIPVFGSKNAATPIIAATILTTNKCILHNIPKIGDVLTMLEILKSMGSKQKWIDRHSIEIDNKELNPEILDQKLVCKIRSSILLIGPMLARFGSVIISMPGGCHIGSRPIDTHLEGFRALGAITEFDEEAGTYEIKLEKANTNKVVLREFSVTATENVMMLGSKYPFVIKLAAVEPHVTDLGNFLIRLGHKISGLGTSTLTLNPGDAHEENIDYTITYDNIEMGTFAILGVATKSKITVVNIVEDQIDAVLNKLREMGAAFEVDGSRLHINGPAGNLKAAKIDTRLFPGIPTDLQAPFGVLATQSEGRSLIFDTLYDGRLQYIHELGKMGAEGKILDPHRALIQGPSVLHGAVMKSLDLRAGATLVIAALIAKGESTINDAEQIDRGYECFDERLISLGADIKRQA